MRQPKARGERGDGEGLQRHRDRPGRHVDLGGGGDQQRADQHHRDVGQQARRWWTWAQELPRIVLGVVSVTAIALPSVGARNSAPFLVARPARAQWPTPRLRSSFDTSFDPQTGALVEVAPGVARVTAPNAGPYTFTGTNSFLIGDDEVAVLDPGPDDARASRGAARRRSAGGRSRRSCSPTRTAIIRRWRARAARRRPARRCGSRGRTG